MNNFILEKIMSRKQSKKVFFSSFILRFSSFFLMVNLLLFIVSCVLIEINIDKILTNLCNHLMYINIALIGSFLFSIIETRKWAYKFGTEIEIYIWIRLVVSITISILLAEIVVTDSNWFMHSKPILLCTVFMFPFIFFFIQDSIVNVINALLKRNKADLENNDYRLFSQIILLQKKIEEDDLESMQNQCEVIVKFVRENYKNQENVSLPPTKYKSDVEKFLLTIIGILFPNKTISDYLSNYNHIFNKQQKAQEKSSNYSNQNTKFQNVDFAKEYTQKTLDKLNRKK